MKKILILYHSGSGSTKTISEVLTQKLSESFEVDLKEITLDFDYSMLNNYELTAFGFPTFGCEPPKTVREFIDRMPVFDTPRKGFIFTTYAIYQENCTRHFIQRISKKNFIIGNHAGIRGPASDGSLLFPENWKFIYTYEKKIKEKLSTITDNIKNLVDSQDIKTRLPAPRWYTPINRAMLCFLEKQYEEFTTKITLLPDRCINCKLCINQCIRGCWSDNDGHPSFDHSNCELCLRCVHNCPKMAIIFVDSMKDRPRLNKAFYSKKKQELLSY